MPEGGREVANNNYYSHPYTRSPLQDSRLLGPRPWKVLAATYEQMGSWATRTLAKILWWRILWWRPGVWLLVVYVNSMLWYIYIYIYICILIVCIIYIYRDLLHYIVLVWYNTLLLSEGVREAAKTNTQSNHVTDDIINHTTNNYITAI